MRPEMVIAKVHYEAQRNIQQLHIRQQLHSITLQIAWFYRLRLNHKAIVHKQITPKLLLESRSHIGNGNHFLAFNLMARNLQRLLKTSDAN